MQTCLEDAIAGRTAQTVRITGAGRTDAGVHGLGQVISFGCETRIPADRMAIALNSVLPPDVGVRRVDEVDEQFNARFSASSRLYAYLILNRPLRSPLLRRYSARCEKQLDIEAMQHACAGMLGERNFGAFANELDAAQPTWREVTRFQVGRYHAFVVVRIEANAFLRGMVRTLVGTLLDVGVGKRTPEAMQGLLETPDRRLAGPSAPPQGLCLLKVRYGERKQYPRREG